MEKNIERYGRCEMSKNDDKILTLKKQIEEKKNVLGKQPKFLPVTTCVVTYNNSKINIHTLTSIKDIETMMIYFNMYIMSAKDLQIDYNNICFDGFSVLDWIEDLKSKKRMLEYNEKKQQLNTLEKKLDKLLSDEKKTELEIDAIASLIEE